MSLLIPATTNLPIRIPHLQHPIVGEYRSSFHAVAARCLAGNLIEMSACLLVWHGTDTCDEQNPRHVGESCWIAERILVALKTRDFNRLC
jgi:hypothetical protein